MARAGDAVVGLSEALEVVVLEHAEQAALVELAKRMIDVVGVAPVTLEVFAVDAMKGAPDLGDVVVGHDIVGEQREEAGATVVVGEDLEEHAHLIEDVADEQAGAGVLDHADERAGVEAVLVLVLVLVLLSNSPVLSSSLVVSHVTPCSAMIASIFSITQAVTSAA